eukprot:9467791-Pyramimonas_sp.AAC.1
MRRRRRRRNMFFLHPKGNKNTLLSAFTNDDGVAHAKKVRPILIHASEESISERYEGHLRSFTTIEQHENMYIVTKDNLELKEHDSLHFEGTNRGNMIGPVGLPSWKDDNEVWRIPVDLKKEVLGKDGIVLVGGAADQGAKAAEAAVKSKQKTTGTDGKETVFWHALPEPVDEELVHRYDLKAVINLTVGPAMLAMACLRKRRPYCGITLTQKHADLIIQHLEMKVSKAMQTEGDPLHEPSLAELLNVFKEEPAEEENQTPPPKPKRKPRRKKADEAGAGGEDGGEGGGEEGTGEKPAKRGRKGGSKMTRAELLKKLKAAGVAGEGGADVDEAEDADSASG